jgi:protein-disulfide isomerase
MALAFAAPVQAADAFTAEQKTEIQKIVAEYLRDNPQAIIDSVNGMRAKEEKEMQEKAEANIGKFLPMLTAADAPSIGNPKGDVTVVEFFDYHCGYCKRALPDVNALIQDDKNVRVVFHEMPILSADSQTAALWALAAHKQGKYFEFHSKLMTTQGTLNEAALTKIGTDLGLDMDKLKAKSALTAHRPLLSTASFSRVIWVRTA